MPPGTQPNLRKSVRSPQPNSAHSSVWQVSPQDRSSSFHMHLALFSLEGLAHVPLPTALTAKQCPDLFSTGNVSKKILLLTVHRKLMKYLNNTRRRCGDRVAYQCPVRRRAEDMQRTKPGRPQIKLAAKVFSSRQ